MGFYEPSSPVRLKNYMVVVLGNYSFDIMITCRLWIQALA